MFLQSRALNFPLKTQIPRHALWPPQIHMPSVLAILKAPSCDLWLSINANCLFWTIYKALLCILWPSINANCLFWTIYKALLCILWPSINANCLFWTIYKALLCILWPSINANCPVLTIYKALLCILWPSINANCPVLTIYKALLCILWPSINANCLFGQSTSTVLWILTIFGDLWWCSSGRCIGQSYRFFALDELYLPFAHTIQGCLGTSFYALI